MIEISRQNYAKEDEVKRDGIINPHNYNIN